MIQLLLSERLLIQNVRAHFWVHSTRTSTNRQLIVSELVSIDLLLLAQLKSLLHYRPKWKIVLTMED